MKHIFLIFFLILSCQSSSRSKNFKEEIPETKANAKVDTSKLHVYIEAVDFETRTYAGILLKPQLDPLARSIQYKICALPEKTNCVRGEIDGLFPDAVYDAPQGELEISYRPCVPQYMALDKECGEKQFFIFNHSVKNHVLKSLNLTRDEWVRKIYNAEYELPNPTLIKSQQDDFYILTYNIAMDSRLARHVFTTSELFVKHIKAVRALTDSPYDIAIGFLSLGNIDVMTNLIEKAKETIAWKYTMKRQLAYYRPMVSGKKTLKKIVDMLTDEHLSSDKKEILIKIQNSFK